MTVRPFPVPLQPDRTIDRARLLGLNRGRAIIDARSGKLMVRGWARWVFDLLNVDPTIEPETVDALREDYLDSFLRALRRLQRDVSARAAAE